ncbi:hypothetical protein RRG08_044167 [Elysia crispata]|uniref:Uncharacterized protein n=1 Tax=Elysia crispata TaxID=231223 RepID=A0AAE1CNR0_9GAST|nr:hypothetical protein RRG08_044167 [Elysia crispata]
MIGEAPNSSPAFLIQITTYPCMQMSDQGGLNPATQSTTLLHYATLRRVMLTAIWRSLLHFLQDLLQVASLMSPNPAEESRTEARRFDEAVLASP